MNTAGEEWAARVRAQNEIEVAKARAAHTVCVPLSAGGGRGATALPTVGLALRHQPHVNDGIVNR